MSTRRISLEDYADLCAQTDYNPVFDPAFVEYYFGRLGETPRIQGKFDRLDRLVAGFPVLFLQVFPSPLHKRLLRSRAACLGNIGQPEGLFPVLPSARDVALNAISPTTSPLLRGRVRGLENRSLRRIAIAKDRRHKKVTHRRKVFLEGGGREHFTDEIPGREFAEIYARLHAERWRTPLEEQRFARQQIEALYERVYGVVLFQGDEPVAAQLCHRAVGSSLFYVDFVNAGVKLTDDHDISYGSIMMLATLRRAESDARALGKSLRFSFGYFYGSGGYKAVWADPETTFVGF